MAILRFGRYISFMKFEYDAERTAVQLRDIIRTEAANMARALHLLEDLGAMRHGLALVEGGKADD